jgi:hypothetical protein
MEWEHVFVSEQAATTPAAEPWVKNAGRPPEGKSTSEIRDCRRHGLVEWHLYRAGKGTTRWRCKRCLGEAVTRRHQKVKRILVSEAGGRCAICGYSRCIINLHFHHVDPATKSFHMSVSSGKSMAKYRAEAAKCVLVCANCHGEIEMGLITSPPPGTQYRASLPPP